LMLYLPSTTAAATAAAAAADEASWWQQHNRITSYKPHAHSTIHAPASVQQSKTICSKTAAICYVRHTPEQTMLGLSSSQDTNTNNSHGRLPVNQAATEKLTAKTSVRAASGCCLWHSGDSLAAAQTQPKWHRSHECSAVTRKPRQTAPSTCQGHVVIDVPRSTTQCAIP
jgi:hypothetical protein